MKILWNISQFWGESWDDPLKCPIISTQRAVCKVNGIKNYKNSNIWISKWRNLSSILHLTSLHKVISYGCNNRLLYVTSRGSPCKRDSIDPIRKLMRDFVIWVTVSLYPTFNSFKTFPQKLLSHLQNKQKRNRKPNKPESAYKCINYYQKVHTW